MGDIEERNGDIGGFWGPVDGCGGGEPDRVARSEGGHGFLGVGGEVLLEEGVFVGGGGGGP